MSCSGTGPLRVTVISVLLLTFGYAQIQAGFAAYAVDVAEIPARALGWAFGANTVVIVLGQLVALRSIKGRRRTSMLALCALTWSASWAVIATSDAVDGWVAVALVVVGLGIFGLGETLWAPVAPAIVNDLAHVWVACTVGGTAVAAVLFLGLRRHLSRAQDGLEPEVVLAA